MSKRPPQALPGDPGHPRGIKYYGLYVVWWDDGNWEWVKCVNCGAELTTPASRERGCGPTCAQVVTGAAKEAILRQERDSAAAYLDEKENPQRRHRTARARSTAGIGDDVPPPPRTGRRKSKGITNEQAKELGRLQKAAGERYTGSGMTENQAWSEIRRLKRALGQ